MGNTRDRPPLSSLQIHIHTADASEFPSFELTAHLATPTKNEKSQPQTVKLCNISNAYLLFKHCCNMHYLKNTVKQTHAKPMQNFKFQTKKNSFTSTWLEMRTGFLNGTISPSKEHMATMCWHCSSNMTLWMPAEIHTAYLLCPTLFVLVQRVKPKEANTAEKKQHHGKDQKKKLTEQTDLQTASWGVTG